MEEKPAIWEVYFPFVRLSTKPVAVSMNLAACSGLLCAH